MALATLAFCSCKGPNVHFSRTKTTNPLAEVNRELKGFERIELLGSLDVKYMQADSFSVKVKAPLKVLGDVETRVEGDKLVVNMKKDISLFNLNGADGDDVTVYVTSPDFLGIVLKGSGDFYCKRHLDTDTLNIALKGSGDIKFEDIICDLVHVSLIGSGDIEVRKVTAQQSWLDLVGSGDIKMTFDNSGRVESRLMGSGDIKLRGSVKENRTHVRGSGEIDTNELKIGK